MVDRSGIEGVLYLTLDPQSVAMINQQLSGTMAGQTVAGEEGASPTGESPAVQAQKETTQSTKTVSEEIKKGNVDMNAHNEAQGMTQQQMASTLGVINTGISMGIGLFMGILSTGFEFIEKIWKIIIDHSPNLKAILDLFDMAVTLFFLPIGTAIMMEILPILVGLLDDVSGVMGVLWDAYETGGLTEMFAIAMSKVVPLFFEAIYNAISILPETGVLGSIRNVLLIIVAFIRDHGEALLTTMINVFTITVKFASVLLAHIPLFGALLGIIVGLMIAQMAVQIAIAMGSTLFSDAPGALLAIPILGGAIGLAGGVALEGMAEGGVVHSTPGGVLVPMAEGGEDEFVVPRSKAQGFAQSVMGAGAGTTVIVYGNVYADDLKDIIVDAVSREVSNHRLRSTLG